jgi:hypothetical protein
VPVHPKPGDLEAFPLQPARGLAHGWVLYLGDDQVALLRAGGAGDAEDREAVGLRAAAVKRISDGDAPMRAATDARARSTASRAAAPRAWIEDGFPRLAPRCGSMASSTRGSRGVVAALSR